MSNSKNRTKMFSCWWTKVL